MFVRIQSIRPQAITLKICYLSVTVFRKLHRENTTSVKLSGGENDNTNVSNLSKSVKFISKLTFHVVPGLRVVRHLIQVYFDKLKEY
jgi:hypothetical protein